MAACNSAPPKHSDRGDVLVSFDIAASPSQAALLSELDAADLFAQLSREINELFALPVDLHAEHQGCGGDANAYYVGSERKIVLCYELLEFIAATTRSASAEDIVERIEAAWEFVFFHELGHALIQLYDIPVLGKEEDAVDAFSTLLLIETGRARGAVFAADYWDSSDPGHYGPTQFADTHSLNAQRFYAILCLVYGSSPEEHQDLIAHDYLSEGRASACIADYARTAESWNELIDGWRKTP